MLRAGFWRVKAASAYVLLACALLLALGNGCFSRRYAPMMETHLEVLSAYATKLETLAQDQRTVPAQDWGEFTYPLTRARQFAQLAASYYPERGSLRAFQAAVDAYATLTADPDVLERPDAEQVVAAEVARFRAAVAKTRDALARETE